MDVKNILIDDTNGDLSKDLFKNHIKESALSVWFAEDSKKRVLNLATNNIKFDSKSSQGSVVIKLYEPLPSKIELKTEKTFNEGKLVALLLGFPLFFLNYF